MVKRSIVTVLCLVLALLTVFEVDAGRTAKDTSAPPTVAPSEHEVASSAASGSGVADDAATKKTTEPASKKNLAKATLKVEQHDANGIGSSSAGSSIAADTDDVKASKPLKSKKRAAKIDDVPKKSTKPTTKQFDKLKVEQQDAVSSGSSSSGSDGSTVGDVKTVKGDKKSAEEESKLDKFTRELFRKEYNKRYPLPGDSENGEDAKPTTAPPKKTNKLGGVVLKSLKCPEGHGPCQAVFEDV